MNAADSDSDADFLSEDGEELDNVSDARRQALSLDARRDRPDLSRRLSREYVTP